MPWCEDCSRFWTPTSMGKGGTCPTCQRVIADPKSVPRVPWHFWLLLAGIGVYLAFRAWQGIVWVGHQL